jgi:hypothetical protein
MLFLCGAPGGIGVTEKREHLVAMGVQIIEPCPSGLLIVGSRMQP